MLPQAVWLVALRVSRERPWCAAECRECRREGLQGGACHVMFLLPSPLTSAAAGEARRRAERRRRRRREGREVGRRVAREAAIVTLGQGEREGVRGGGRVGRGGEGLILEILRPWVVLCFLRGGRR